MLWGCKSLSKLGLPKQLFFIGSSCFGETSIKELVLPDRVNTVLDTAFWHSNIKKIYVSKLNKHILRKCILSDSMELIEYE